MLRTRGAENWNVASPGKAAVIPSEYFDIRERREVQWELFRNFRAAAGPNKTASR